MKEKRGGGELDQENTASGVASIGKYDKGNRIKSIKSRKRKSDQAKNHLKSNQIRSHPTKDQSCSNHIKAIENKIQSHKVASD